MNETVTAILGEVILFILFFGVFGIIGKKIKEKQKEIKNYIPLLKKQPHLLNEMLHGKELEQMRKISLNIASIGYSGGFSSGGAIIEAVLKDGSQKWFNLETKKINNELKITNIKENTNPTEYLQDKLINPLNQLPKTIGTNIIYGIISFFSLLLSLALMGAIIVISLQQGIIDESFMKSENGPAIVFFTLIFHMFVVSKLINKVILIIFGLDTKKGKLLEAIIANSSNNSSVRSKLSKFKKIKESNLENGKITNILAIHKDGSEHWYRAQTEGKGTRSTIKSLTRYS